MPSYTTADIRNVALVGHAGAGKTSLVEALLREAGVIHHTGLVEKGDTVSDFTDDEKQHKHSLYNGIVHADYQGKHINLIDTPGYPEFIAYSIYALSASETVAVVINAVTGIEPITRKMMEIAKDRNLCRMIIVNKIDHEGVDLAGLVEQIKEAFGSECLPINLPADGATKVIDCFGSAEGDSDLGPVSDAHTHIIDQVVEVDEALMATYLEQGDVKPEQLHDPFEKALREGHLVPICFTAARRHDNPAASVGVKELLDLLVKLGPSPLEGNPRTFLKDNDEIVRPTPDAAKPVIAHVFSVSIDSFVGKLCAFRVHQGTIRSGSQLSVSNPHAGEGSKPFKLAHFFKVLGKDHKEVHEAIPGDIAAVAKLDNVHRDSTLVDKVNGDNLHLRSLPVPIPMHGLAITAKNRGDETKISDALHKILAEDPGFKVTRDRITHETVIHGMGERHLRTVLEKLKKRYNIEVETKPPKIASRETIMAKAEGHHRHKKQTGGAGQFGEVFLRVEPLERGAGFEFVNDVFGGTIPSQYIPAVEKGVRQALEQGAIAGYPLQDIRVSVYDGKYHPVDSKEVAFVAAGKRAFLDAVMKARPALLEPCVKLEVTVPQARMGDITGDLSGKRGRIQGTDMIGADLAIFKAVVPLAEVTNYQSQLKSVTGGQGSYSMEFSHFDPVPGNIQQQIAGQYKPKEEED